jgi:hypothetical protein
MQLMKEIEQEAEAKEKAQRGESAAAIDDQGASPLTLKTEGEISRKSPDEDVKMECGAEKTADAEGDVKMEEGIQ